MISWPARSSITLAADQDMFLTLAKFRAMRLLWARMLDVAHLPATALKLHGETSWRMMTAKDPHTNILRATAAVFGAGLGGADLIAVSAILGCARLARWFCPARRAQFQNIFLRNPISGVSPIRRAGSGYVESLTAIL